MTLTDLIPFRKQRHNESSLPVRRESDNPFLQLQDEMNRVFDAWLSTPQTGFPSPLGFGNAMSDLVPDVDVQETKKEVRVTAELPGVDTDDLDVRLDHDTLIIRGEKREQRSGEEGNWSTCECSYGSFARSIPLGVPVDPDGVKANFRRGVLRVTLPKAKPGQGDVNRIEVKAG